MIRAYAVGSAPVAADLHRIPVRLERIHELLGLGYANIVFHRLGNLKADLSVRI
jgi:hypothetical protein